MRSDQSVLPALIRELGSGVALPLLNAAIRDRKTRAVCDADRGSGPAARRRGGVRALRPGFGLGRGDGGVRLRLNSSLSPYLLVTAIRKASSRQKR